MDHNGSHVDSGIFLNRSNIPTWYIFPFNFFLLFSLSELVKLKLQKHVQSKRLMFNLYTVLLLFPYLCHC